MLMLTLMRNSSVDFCGKLDFPINKSHTQTTLAQVAVRVIVQIFVRPVANVSQHVTYSSSQWTITIKHARTVTLAVLRDVWDSTTAPYVKMVSALAVMDFRQGLPAPHATQVKQTTPARPQTVSATIGLSEDGTLPLKTLAWHATATVSYVMAELPGKISTTVLSAQQTITLTCSYAKTTVQPDIP